MATETETMLVRKAISVESLQELDSRTLAEARTVLGYGKQRPKQKQINIIAQVFRELEIEPFDNRTVKRYKSNLVREKNSRISINAYTRWYWGRFEISRYRRPIPLFALARAVSLTKALTRAGVGSRVEIETLRRYRDDDPFMVLVAAGCRFYLDVWDEPKFEGRRRK